MLIVMQAIHLLFIVFQLMLLVRVLSSWIPEIQDKRWLAFIAYYTDPYLNLFRSIIPPLGMMDISPVIAFFALQFLETGVIYLLRMI